MENTLPALCPWGWHLHLPSALDPGNCLLPPEGAPAGQTLRAALSSHGQYLKAARRPLVSVEPWAPPVAQREARSSVHPSGVGTGLWNLNWTVYKLPVHSDMPKRGWTSTIAPSSRCHGAGRDFLPSPAHFLSVAAPLRTQWAFPATGPRGHTQRCQRLQHRKPKPWSASCARAGTELAAARWGNGAGRPKAVARNSGL